MGKANYDLPDRQLAAVVRASGARSKREAIVIALGEYLKQRATEKLIASYGKIPLRWTPRALRKYRG